MIIRLITTFIPGGAALEVDAPQSPPPQYKRPPPGDKGLPEFHTLDYDLTLNFANGQSIHAVNTSVNSGFSDILSDLIIPITEACKIHLTKSASRSAGDDSRLSTARAAEILSVMVPQSKYEPGETVRAYIAYQPFRQEEATMPVDMQLPRDLPNGTYQLTVSDWNHFLDDERTNSAFKFTAENTDETFAVLNT